MVCEIIFVYYDLWEIKSNKSLVIVIKKIIRVVSWVKILTIGLLNPKNKFQENLMRGVGWPTNPAFHVNQWPGFEFYHWRVGKLQWLVVVYLWVGGGWGRQSSPGRSIWLDSSCPSTCHVRGISNEIWKFNEGDYLSLVWLQSLKVHMIITSLLEIYILPAPLC